MMMPSPLTRLSSEFPTLKAPKQGYLDTATCVLFGENLHQGDWSAFCTSLGEALMPLAGWRIAGIDVLALSLPYNAELQALCWQYGWDIAPLDHPITLKAQGVLVMDMDSTAIEIECIDEIAKLAGVGEEVAQVTERAMQGELDFEASLRQRVATLEGASESILSEVKRQLPLMPGLQDLSMFLQHHGWFVAIASGGFTYFAEVLKDKLDLSDIKANELEIEEGILTGKIKGEVVDAQSKADFLLALSERYQVVPSNTLAIGDGANDLPMIAQAGLGIAYHAKPSVQAQAPMAIRFTDLRGVIAVLSASLYTSFQ